MLVSEKITSISAYSSRGCSRPRFGSCTGSESSFTPLSTKKSLSLSGTEPNLQGLHAAFTSPGGKAGTPPIPGLCFHKKSMFLYSILKSAANVVPKFMSAVIAIERVLFVSKNCYLIVLCYLSIHLAT